MTYKSQAGLSIIYCSGYQEMYFRLPVIVEQTGVALLVTYSKYFSYTTLIYTVIFTDLQKSFQVATQLANCTGICLFVCLFHPSVGSKIFVKQWLMMLINSRKHILTIFMSFVETSVEKRFSVFCLPSHLKCENSNLKLKCKHLFVINIHILREKLQRVKGAGRSTLY